MIKNNIFSYIQEKLGEGEEIAPFLFISHDIELCNNFVSNLAKSLCELFEVDKNSIFTLEKEEQGRHIKIKDIRQFLLLTAQRASFKFQIFIIESIETMTEESANACLKFFEEPGKGNLVFLTSASESGILETILSRVQVISIQEELIERNQEYGMMIGNFIQSGDLTLLTYTEKNVFDKDSAVLFLKEIILFLGDLEKFPEEFADIEEDMLGLKRNNLIPKYMVDKYVLLLVNMKSKKNKLQ